MHQRDPYEFTPFATDWRNEADLLAEEIAAECAYYDAEAEAEQKAWSEPPRCRVDDFEWRGL